MATSAELEGTESAKEGTRHKILGLGGWGREVLFSRSSDTEAVGNDHTEPEETNSDHCMSKT